MFNQYPYINLNDLNLDYILRAIKEMRNEVTNFVSINAIKYADPIQWSITSQYEKNTIVIDPVTGTAYISVAAVPAGVALTRTEFWTVVFDLGSFVTRAAQNFTSRWESETTLTATFSTPAGGWLVWGDVLFKALVNITAGDTYVENGNIEHFTIEDLYTEYLNEINAIVLIIGDLQDLTTSDTTDIVHAINSVLNDLNITIGDLSGLSTSDTSSIVNAINSVLNDLNTVNDNSVNRDNALGERIDDLVVGVPRPNLLLNSDFRMIVDNFYSLVCPPDVSYYSDTALTDYVGQTPTFITAIWHSESYSIINIGGTDYYVAFNDCKRGYVGISRTGQYTYAPWVQGSNIITWFNLRHLDGLHMRPIGTYDANSYMAQPINYGDDKIDGFNSLLNRKLTASIVVNDVVYSTTFERNSLPQLPVTLAAIDNEYFTLKINYNARAYQDTGFLWYVIIPKQDIVVTGAKFEVGDTQTLYSDGNIIDPPTNLVDITAKIIQFEYNPFMRTAANYVFIPTMGRYNSPNRLIVVLQPPMPFVVRPSMGYDPSVEPLYIQQSGNTIKTDSITFEQSSVENSLNLIVNRDTADSNLFADATFLIQRRSYRTAIWFYVNVIQYIMV